MLVFTRYDSRGSGIPGDSKNGHLTSCHGYRQKVYIIYITFHTCFCTCTCNPNPLADYLDAYMYMYDNRTCTVRTPGRESEDTLVVLIFEDT